MGGTLRLDTATIESAARNVNRVVTRLNSAPSDAQALEGMIPARDLRDVSVDFSSKWEITRKELIEELEQVKEQLGSIVEAFEEIDQGLTSSLEDAEE